MSEGFRVALALSRAPERTLISAWLQAAGNTVVPLVEACHVDTRVAGRGFGCVLADSETLKNGFLAALRRDDPRLPVVALVDRGGDDDSDLRQKGLRTLFRPIEEASVTLAVSLAYGETRQTRRSLRQRTPRLPSQVGVAPAEILDVSVDGVRLELSNAHGAALRPQFRLRVPICAVDVMVRRVWVRGAANRVQCGAVLVAPDATQRLAWERVVDLAGTSGSITSEGSVAPAAMNTEDRDVLGELSKRIASAPFVGGLAGRLTARLTGYVAATDGGRAARRK